MSSGWSIMCKRSRRADDAGEDKCEVKVPTRYVTNWRNDILVKRVHERPDPVQLVIVNPQLDMKGARALMTALKNSQSGDRAGTQSGDRACSQSGDRACTPFRVLINGHANVATTIFCLKAEAIIMQPGVSFLSALNSPLPKEDYDYPRVGCADVMNYEHDELLAMHARRTVEEEGALISEFDVRVPPPLRVGNPQSAFAFEDLCQTRLPVTKPLPEQMKYFSDRMSMSSSFFEN